MTTNISFSDALKQAKLGILLAFIQQVTQGSIDPVRFPLMAIEVSDYIYPEWNLGFSLVEDEVTLTDQVERKVVYRGTKTALSSSPVAEAWKAWCEVADISEALTRMGEAVIKSRRQGYKGDFHDNEVYDIWKSTSSTQVAIRVAANAVVARNSGSKTYNQDNIQPIELELLLESAKFTVTIDSSGGLFVQENSSDNPFGCYLFIHNKGYWIQLMALAEFKPEASLRDKLVLANRINANLIIIRAAINGHGQLELDYYISVEGGLNGENIVSATRRFLHLLDDAIDKDDEHILK